MVSTRAQKAKLEAEKLDVARQCTTPVVAEMMSKMLQRLPGTGITKENNNKFLLVVPEEFGPVESAMIRVMGERESVQEEELKTLSTREKLIRLASMHRMEPGWTHEEIARRFRIIASEMKYPLSHCVMGELLIISFRCAPGAFHTVTNVENFLTLVHPPITIRHMLEDVLTAMVIGAPPQKHFVPIPAPTHHCSYINHNDVFFG